MDMEKLRSWIGRTERRIGIVTPAPAAALAATLDRNDPYLDSGAELPTLWHWLYCPHPARQSELGHDGHPARGRFLPPVPLSRRMWAASRILIERPLRVGDEITRRSEITAISCKKRTAGAMVLVTVTHEITAGGTPAITEEQDIAYVNRSEVGGAGRSPESAPTNEDYAREVTADPVLLFRYSALTFNSHRIHYDHRYAVDVEGYQGLVVHGPLIATLLLELLRQNTKAWPIRAVSFKAVRPIFEGEPFSVCGRGNWDQTVDLWARDYRGLLAMRSSVKFA